MGNRMPINRSVERIADRYSQPGDNWVLGFSGGKDSTAVLLATIAALRKVGRREKAVTVVFCDTGVENPLLVDFVKVVFRRLRYLSDTEKLPIKSAILRPEVKNRFWVKVIGRGCPPPTNRFRWCTDKLRVNPIRDYIRSTGLNEALTLTGIREEESQQRKRTSDRYATREDWILRYYDASQRHYFCPILDYSTNEVWKLLGSEAIGYGRWK